MKIKIKRLAKGDLPDWIACEANLSSLTVAEAKGCHDPSGPARALDRAWNQAGRIDVTVRGSRVTLKRVAIATRWGVAKGKPSGAFLSVRDPIDKGEPLEPHEKDALFIGILRLHIANLIEPLGHVELAKMLRSLTLRFTKRSLDTDIQNAQGLLNNVPVGQLDKATATDDLVGGVVTRAGPITDSAVTPADQEMLARLNLRPVFVGIERDLIRAAIDGHAQDVRSRLAEQKIIGEFARSDHAGGWIIPLGKEQTIIRGT